MDIDILQRQVKELRDWKAKHEQMLDALQEQYREYLEGRQRRDAEPPPWEPPPAD